MAWSGFRTHVAGEGHDPVEVANYILWLGRDSALSPMQLLKLSYISHGWMLGLHGRPLLNEPVEAWQYGPVVPSVYRKFKRFGSQAVTTSPGAEPAGFGAQERSVMEQVWAAYRAFSGIQLSALTHQDGSPWAITWKIHGRNGVISNDLIEEHYRNLAASRATA